MLLCFEIRSEVRAVLALEFFNPPSKGENAALLDIQLIEEFRVSVEEEP